MAKLFLTLAVLISVSVAYAVPTELAGCQPGAAGASSEEARARKEAEKAKLSDSEVLARLIFSEALSSGYWRGLCKAPSTEALFEGIGWGVVNRVKKAGGANPYFETIFARGQFRTSFSSAKKEIDGFSGKITNPFAVAFLCPHRAQTYLNHSSQQPSAIILFGKAMSVAKQITATNNIPEKYRGITNFFYPKSEFFGEMRPAWAKNPVASKNKGYRDLLGVDKPCVEFYHLD
jgi:hypothetical protein